MRATTHLWQVQVRQAPAPQQHQLLTSQGGLSCLHNTVYLANTWRQ